MRILPALLCLAATAAHADIITITAGDYAIGTDLSHVGQGVVLSAEDVPFAHQGDPLPAAQFYPILAVACPDPDRSGCVLDPVMFGHQAGLDWPYFAAENRFARYVGYRQGSEQTGFTVFRADFDGGTSFAQLQGGGGQFGEFFRVDFWAVDGTHLAQCSTDNISTADGCQFTDLGTHGDVPKEAGVKDPWIIGLSREVGDIGFVTAGGYAGDDFVAQITYSAPEPGTLALFSAGLAICFALRRRAMA